MSEDAPPKIDSTDIDSILASLQVLMVNQDEELVDGNLLNWTVTSVEQELILIKLEFEQPLEVSQGDEPDYLVI